MAATNLSQPFHLKLHVPPGSAEGFERWRAAVAPMFAMDIVDPAERQSFSFDAAVVCFADMSVTSARSSAVFLARDQQRIARSGMEQFVVTAQLNGGHRFSAEGRETEVRAGDIRVLDMTRPCHVEGTSYSQMTIVMPRAALEPLVADIDALHGVVLRHGSPLNALLLSHMRMLHGEAPNFGNSDAGAAARATEGLVAACLGPSTAGKETAQTAMAAAVLHRLRHLIDKHLGDPNLGPDLLCRHGGVSRATLYRLFEPFGGVSNHIRQRRVARAFRMLSDPARRTERVKDVAVRCGFTSDAVFSRALRQTYGKSPSDIRAAAGNGEGQPLSRDADDSFAKLNRWLLGRDATAR